MKNPKLGKSESSIKKMSAQPPSKHKKKQKGHKVEELFGVHIISESDIKNHFGTSEEKTDGVTENKKRK